MRRLNNDQFSVLTNITVNLLRVSHEMGHEVSKNVNTAGCLRDQHPGRRRQLCASLRWDVLGGRGQWREDKAGKSLLREWP